jgi:hypothetical protein
MRRENVIYVIVFLNVQLLVLAMEPNALAPPHSETHPRYSVNSFINT